MKKYFAIFLVVVLCFMLIGCTAPNDNGNNDDVSSQETLELTTYELPNTGGDANRWFYGKYILKADNISSLWWEYTNNIAYENWRTNYYERKNAGENMPYPYLVDFIKEMEFTREICNQVVTKMHTIPNWEAIGHLDYEDLDIMLTFDTKQINQRFVSEYAVYANGEIYTPHWILNHSAADYKAAGITAAQIEEKLPTYAQFLGAEHQDYTQLYTQKLNDLKALEK